MAFLFLHDVFDIVKYSINTEKHIKHLQFNKDYKETEVYSITCVVLKIVNISKFR